MVSIVLDNFMSQVVLNLFCRRVTGLGVLLIKVVLQLKKLVPIFAFMGSL